MAQPQYSGFDEEALLTNRNLDDAQVALAKRLTQIPGLSDNGYRTDFEPKSKLSKYRLGVDNYLESSITIYASTTKNVSPFKIHEFFLNAGISHPLDEQPEVIKDGVIQARFKVDGNPGDTQQLEYVVYLNLTPERPTLEIGKQITYTGLREHDVWKVGKYGLLLSDISVTAGEEFGPSNPSLGITSRKKYSVTEETRDSNRILHFPYGIPDVDGLGGLAFEVKTGHLGIAVPLITPETEAVENMPVLTLTANGRSFRNKGKVYWPATHQMGEFKVDNLLALLDPNGSFKGHFYHADAWIQSDQSQQTKEEGQNYLFVPRSSLDDIIISFE